MDNLEHRDHLMPGLVHIVGAGLSGLAAAVRLTEAGIKVIIHEAANHAGGRCRSYYDPMVGLLIDNGNHLVLSGNQATLAYLSAIGTRKLMRGPGSATFPFIDLATNERWTLRINDGRFPWWIFNDGCRVPGTATFDYVSLLRLLWAEPKASIRDVLTCEGRTYERFLRPLLRAALNIEPSEGSVGLASAVLRETITSGGRACHPLIARDGLSSCFVDPALDLIQRHTGTVRFGHRLRACVFDTSRATALDFGDEIIPLTPDQAVILAVPPLAAAALLPGLQTPTEFRAIINAHFRFDGGKDVPLMIGAVNGTLEWLFSFPQRLSVTISSADHLLNIDRDVLAQRIWLEISKILGISAPLPPWQVVRERRATFAALPYENAKRPATKTSWPNVVLAGDWTATGLPATIEGAIRSGNRAAQLVGGINSL
jgi:hydroxysqualene dehydroxylase